MRDGENFSQVKCENRARIIWWFNNSPMSYTVQVKCESCAENYQTYCSTAAVVGLIIVWLAWLNGSSKWNCNLCSVLSLCSLYAHEAFDVWLNTRAFAVLSDCVYVCICAYACALYRVKNCQPFYENWQTFFCKSGLRGGNYFYAKTEDSYCKIKQCSGLCGERSPLKNTLISRLNWNNLVNKLQQTLISVCYSEGPTHLITSRLRSAWRLLG